jgi:hypothetical protein
MQNKAEEEDWSKENATFPPTLLEEKAKNDDIKPLGSFNSYSLVAPPVMQLCLITYRLPIPVGEPIHHKTPPPPRSRNTRLTEK